MAAPMASTRRRRISFFANREARRHGDFAMPHKAQAKSPALKRAADYVEPAAGRTRALDIEWQVDAYTMSREVGEAGYVMHLIANTVAMCNFVVKRRGPNGSLEDLEEGSKDYKAADNVMKALIGPRGGTREVKRRLGLHAAIAGEWYLLGADDAKDGILWEIVSVQELHIDPSGQITRSKDGMRWEPVDPEQTVVARGWISDPEFTDRADSGMKRALSTCREIAAHSQVVEASSKSRVAAGLLFVPDDLSFGADDDESEDDAMDALTEELLRHLSAPIQNKASVASYVPLVIRGKAELGEKIAMIDLGRNIDQIAVDLRDRGLARLATILEIPPEKMTGKGGLNHWTGFNIDADFLANHVTPIGDTGADFLTVAYLQPMLEEYEGYSTEAAAELVVVFDTSPVSVSGDEAASARALHDRDVLSDEALVTASSFDVDQMPDDDELFQRRAWKLAQQPAYARACLPLVHGFEKINVDDLPSSGPPPMAGGVGPDGKPVEAKEAQPVSKSERPAKGEPGDRGDASMPERKPPAEASPSTGTLIAQVLVAADFAVERAVERASYRVADAAVRGGLGDRVPRDRTMVFTRLGPADLSSLGVSAADQFDDAWTGFEGRCRAWVRSWALSHGDAEPAAEWLATEVTDELVKRLTSWVLSTLHTGVAIGPNGYRIPTSVVEDTLRLYAGAMV